MTHIRWQVYRAVRQDEFYAILSRYGADCGAMDGGCVIVALALQEVLGGDLYGVFEDDGKRVQCAHALLLLDGMFIDGDGGGSPKTYGKRWLQNRWTTRKPFAEVIIKPVTEEELRAETDEWEGPFYAAGAMDELVEYFTRELEYERV